MATGPLHVVLRHVRKLAGSQATGEVTDGHLLERFITQRDEAAFELLVRRHERMVWSVCRRLHPSLFFLTVLARGFGSS